MKKLIVLCISLALFVGNSAAQQGGYTTRATDWKHNMAMDAPQLYSSYKKGSTLSGIGAGLTIGGVAAIVIGIATADKETVKNGSSTQVNLSGSGAAVFAAGTVCALAGTPLWIIGGSKKKKARNAYFRDYGYSINIPDKPSPYLQLTPSSYGHGLGLAFVY